MNHTVALVRPVASDASADLVSVLRCVDRFLGSFRGVDLDFLSAKVSQAVSPQVLMARQPPDELQAGFPSRRAAVDLALRLAAHRLAMRSSAAFLPLVAGSAYSLVVLSKLVRQQEPPVSQPALHRFVRQLEQRVAPSVQAHELLAVQSRAAQRSQVQQVWLSLAMDRPVAQVALGLPLRTALAQSSVQMQLGWKQSRAASSPLLPRLPSHLFPLWQRLPRRLPPRPGPKSFCELFRLHPRVSSSSASFFR